MSTKTNIKSRVYLLYILFAVFGLFIISKALYIQIFRGKELKEYSKTLYIKEEVMEPVRGNIYSSQGSLLSTTLPIFDIFWDASVVKKDTFNKYINQICNSLSTILKDKNSEVYKKDLQKAYAKKREYYLIKSNISFENYLKIKALPIFKLSKNKGGFISAAKNRRTNPFNLLANRTIGRYVSNQKNVGLELFYNSYLDGKQGKRLLEKVAGGTWIPLDDNELEPENGKDIFTSLDVDVQEVAENSLLDIVTENNADFGTCMVMEVKTGKLKALANLGKQKDGSYWEDYNYALLNQYPGSTFKLISLMALLEDSLVDIDDYVNVGNGRMRTSYGEIVDSETPSSSDITIKDAFAHSSNVAFAKLIYNNYKKNPLDFIGFVNKIGLDTTSGLDLVGERKPVIKNPKSKDWNSYSLAYMAHGYEELIAPIQMCAIYNAVANNGKMMKPYLVEDIKEYGKSIKHIEPIQERVICSEQTAGKLKEVLGEVVRVGTGKEMQNPFYTIGGKTGTAKWIGNRFDENVYTAFFIGFFPLENPQYTIAVSVKLPKGAAKIYGSEVALPIVKAVADRLYASNVSRIDLKNNWFLNKVSVNENFVASQNDRNIIFKNLPIPSGLTLSTFDKNKIKQGTGMYSVPNVKGMGLKDALYVLENSGFIPLFEGKGKVISQSIEPNTRSYFGQKIKLILN